MDTFDLMHVLAEPRRRRLLQLLWPGERAAGELARAMPEVTFGAVSQHLRLLAGAGAVHVRRDGRHRYYTVDRTALGALAVYLEQQWSAALVNLKQLAEAEEQSDAKELPAAEGRKSAATASKRPVSRAVPKRRSPRTKTQRKPPRAT